MMYRDLVIKVTGMMAAFKKSHSHLKDKIIRLPNIHL